MTGYPLPLQRLIKEFARFPGVGEKTATRLAHFLLSETVEEAKSLAEAIMEVKEKIRLCPICYNLTDRDLCAVCANPVRDRQVICVVEDPDAVIALEETGDFHGVYHVLHGTLSPLDGIGPGEIKLRELMERIDHGSVREVIIATNPGGQGEATAVLISRTLKGKNVQVTRIATGVPVGGDLRYTDRLTLGKAIMFRRNMEAG